MQYWRDELHFQRWRIQRNTLTDHCRLIDGFNCRHAWGTFEGCRERLEEIKRDQNLPPMKGTAVVVVHGLMGWPSVMEPLCARLEASGEFTAFNVGYPSSQGSFAEHAAGLDRILRRLEGIDEIHLVGHSLGNLVIRHYLADQTDPVLGRTPDPRLHRIVMLGPPNHGSKMADLAVRLKGPAWIAGESLELLGPRWKELEPRLATPRCEFGILAGGMGTPEGFNLLLPGDDDGAVAVESARLPGARDFRLMPVRHEFMLIDREMHAFALRFLKHGYFESEGKRQPIE
jgi:pimeloyl-ACP methyl ester carboxylesterase